MKETTGEEVISGQVRPLLRSAAQFHKALGECLARYLPLMRKDWQDVPALTVKVEARLVVTVDFELKDLPHNGRRFFVNPDNEDEDTPEKIARKTVEEIYDHKADCPDCGDGAKTLRDRLREGDPTPPDEIETILFPKLAGRMRGRSRGKQGARKRQAELAGNSQSGEGQPS
jgi:hypothetical protein